MINRLKSLSIESNLNSYCRPYVDTSSDEDYFLPNESNSRRNQQNNTQYVKFVSKRIQFVLVYCS